MIEYSGVILAEFEVKGDRIMLLIKRRMNWLAPAICLVGLLILLGYGAVLPANAQEWAYIEIRVDYQEVEVLDSDGSVAGRGTFRADVKSDRLGGISGLAELQMADFTLHYDFNRLDEILYEDGEPSGAVLGGRGTLTQDGQTETFDGKVRTTVIRHDCLIWDIPGAPEIGIGDLLFDAQGHLEFR
jgi:hypothetical protein